MVVPETESFFVTKPVPAEATLEFRDAVLSPGHPGRPVTAAYDYASGSYHLGLFSADSLLIGCVSAELAPFQGSDPSTSFRFHSMAIDPNYQGKGLGKRILRDLLVELVKRDASLVWATARPSAVEFYRRFGLTVLDEPGTVAETGMQIWYVVSDRDELQVVCQSRATA